MARLCSPSHGQAFGDLLRAINSGHVESVKQVFDTIEDAGKLHEQFVLNMTDLKSRLDLLVDHVQDLPPAGTDAALLANFALLVWSLRWELPRTYLLNLPLLIRGVGPSTSVP